MIEKLITRIANTQAFKPEDKLGQMVRQHPKDELSEESLDLVYAARKDDTSYAVFLRLAQERDGNRK